ncbi:preprotein translocase subunit SecG [Asticcacaulis sp. YBE204]|uniref:preprotein translocase subunit SecG n=1 Tax=Asticcacaulis sp. YBE204 TaxID=1282363 RepID=UPI0003C4077D|nr:preprotein translocase subunit SecG [Asticcacaulis sp. YBE204]ESQ78125.1 hypothetical protein AEYBE204_14875 [Asticcacaulis sp. YBE204]
MLFVILLTVQIIIGIALVGLILVQRSEGGALGMGGGGGGGFMSARGAGNFLTRATSILAVLFFANCIGLTIVSNLDRAGTSVVDQVGADNLKLDESAASAQAAAAQQQQGASSSSASVAPSLTDLPAPTTAAPSLGNLGTSSSSVASSSVAKPAAKPAPKSASASASSEAASQ